MIDLLLCILFTTSLGIFLKLFDRFGLNRMQAIVFNYVSCVITGCVVQQSVPHYIDYMSKDWFVTAFILGCSFLFFFNVMSYIVKHNGITVMSVANKLSLVIPVGAAFFIFQEQMTALKLAGIFFALLAVIFTSVKNEVSGERFNLKNSFVPFLLFVGSGLNDTLVKYAQSFCSANADNAPFNITIFTVSAFAGIIILVWRGVKNKSKIEWKSVAGGLLLGVPNYFSMHYLVKALAVKDLGASVIFPLNNIGVVMASACVAYFLFSEKISKLNLAGILLAILAIVLIAFTA